LLCAAGYRASKVIGNGVLNEANEAIGEIDDARQTKRYADGLQRECPVALPPREENPHLGFPKPRWGQQDGYNRPVKGSPNPPVPPDPGWGFSFALRLKSKKAD